MTTVYDFTAQDITCATIPLSTYQGKVLLIVNTASKCGFTPQYEGLQRLQKDLADRGFAVLGFPCNQSGHQEPGDAVDCEFLQAHLRCDLSAILQDRR